jgi:hypothetical protein
MAKDAARPGGEEVGGVERGATEMVEEDQLRKENRNVDERREPSSPSDDPLIFQRRLHLAEIGLYLLKPHVDVAL